MSGVVVFDYTAFCVMFPELASVSAPTAQIQFNSATMLIDNTLTSPICDLTQRTIILNYATAHFCSLFAPVTPGQPVKPPGRLSSVGEGSVNASFDYVSATRDIQAFWNQTQYGAAVYAMTQQFRTGFYIAARWPASPVVPGSFPWRR